MIKTANTKLSAETLKGRQRKFGILRGAEGSFRQIY